MGKPLIRRRAPSVARLVASFKIDVAAAEEIRGIIHAEKSAEDALEKIGRADLIFHHGNEELVEDRHYFGRDWRSNIIATYLNTGDPYSATLIARNGQVYIGCWGVLAERYIQAEEAI